MPNVFIIGNGFDLDLGLPTYYSDFAKSSFWPIASPIPSQSSNTNYGNVLRVGHSSNSILLEHYLENKKNLNTWFDLENELLLYSQVENKRNGKESEYFIEKNINYYELLRTSLCKYIADVERKTTPKDCVASIVLRAVIANDYFNQIYSFNYTSLNKISHALGVYKDINYTHLHGKVEDNSIILGVDDSSLRPGYEILHKSSSRYYRSHDIYNALTNAQEIVIFGLSFGNIDYSYFDRFFRSLSEGDSISEDNKKNITIFTKDDNSRLSIIGKLREMNIGIQRLYAQSHFQIICTTDEKDKDLLDSFVKRMNETSRATYEAKLDSLSRIF